MPTVEERLTALEQDNAQNRQAIRRVRSRLSQLIDTLAALATNGLLKGAKPMADVHHADKSDRTQQDSL